MTENKHTDNKSTKSFRDSEQQQMHRSSPTQSRNGGGGYDDLRNNNNNSFISPAVAGAHTSSSSNNNIMFDRFSQQPPPQQHLPLPQLRAQERIVVLDDDPFAPISLDEEFNFAKQQTRQPTHGGEGDLLLGSTGGESKECSTWGESKECRSHVVRKPLVNRFAAPGGLRGESEMDIPSFTPCSGYSPVSRTTPPPLPPSTANLDSSISNVPARMPPQNIRAPGENIRAPGDNDDIWGDFITEPPPPPPPQTYRAQSSSGSQVSVYGNGMDFATAAPASSSRHNVPPPPPLARHDHHIPHQYQQEQEQQRHHPHCHLYHPPLSPLQQLQQYTQQQHDQHQEQHLPQQMDRIDSLLHSISQSYPLMQRQEPQDELLVPQTSHQENHHHHQQQQQDRLRSQHPHHQQNYSIGNYDDVFRNSSSGVMMEPLHFRHDPRELNSSAGNLPPPSSSSSMSNSMVMGGGGGPTTTAGGGQSAVTPPRGGGGMGMLPYATSSSSDGGGVFAAPMDSIMPMPPPPPALKRRGSSGGVVPAQLQNIPKILSLSHDDDEDEDEEADSRFKPFHEEKWSHRYKELVHFHREHGHAAVPHTYPPNLQLARWVKRQRRQYKLLNENKPSTMTIERLEMLNQLDFVWDSHEVNWREKLLALDNFRLEHGHCNVPSNYVDKKLATWVKCQRRQYKLYMDGKGSAMCPERIQQLEGRGFEWEVRSSSSKNRDGKPPALSSSDISTTVNRGPPPPGL